MLKIAHETRATALHEGMCLLRVLQKAVVSQGAADGQVVFTETEQYGCFLILESVCGLLDAEE